VTEPRREVYITFVTLVPHPAQWTVIQTRSRHEVALLAFTALALTTAFVAIETISALTAAVFTVVTGFAEAATCL